jgi:hypothetical protein
LITYKDIVSARERIEKYVYKTPLDHSIGLSKNSKNVYLKLECQQRMKSFKLRGALSKLTLLTEEQKARGIMAVSSGNHGAGASPDCETGYFGGGTVLSSGYNLIGQPGTCHLTLGPGDLTNLDPQLGPLQDNGGAVHTQALLPGGPAIDAANPEGCTDFPGGAISTDGRGLPRFQRCDIGAYEMQPIGYSYKQAAPSAVRGNEPVTYTIVLANPGPSPLAGVALMF